jgi:uncharacterized protein (UPF0212 family)
MADFTDCPNCRDGTHSYFISVGSGLKSDFEPVSYGDSAEDTRYKRVEYSYMACKMCGQAIKRKVRVEE